MPKKTDYTTEQAKLVRDIKKTQEEIKKLQSNLIDGDKVQLEIIAEQSKKLKGLQAIYKENAKEINESLSDFEDMEDTMVSIGNTMKKNNKFVDQQKTSFAAIKIATKSIAMELTAGGTTNQKTQKQVIAATNAYKNMHTSIANANKEFAEGNITNEQRIEEIKRQSDAFRDVVSVIDMTKVSSEELKKQLGLMTKESSSFAEEMKHAQINSERLDGVFENFEGIPALGQVNTLLKTNIKDTVAFKAAVFALGAALGKAAFDYFGAPMKAAMQQHKEIEQLGIDGEAERAKMTMDRGFIDRDAAKGYSKIQEASDNNRIETAHNVAQAMNDAAFAGERAANSFAASMQQGAAQFERASKTALFGKSIGGIGYGAAQMQLAGIGADKIASAMEAAANSTGKMPTAKMGADMAVMSERTGTSVDNIAQINEYFERTDKVSANVAMNMQEGLRNMADQAGLNLGKLMQEVADASKEALSYNIKSGPALAKQVAYTQSLGVNFGDIAKAGKNMVMNYKDSIKAEMQLSTLLGKQVDLSEVRAKFAEGDQEGALKALKEQGLQLEDMDMFQKQALQDSLGGLDLESISKVTSKEGKDTGPLKAGNAKAGNQEFLSKTQAAEATLNSKQASISANEAIIDAKLSGKIADAFINSKGNVDYLKAQADQAINSQKLNEEMEKLWKNSEAYNKQLADTSKLNFVDNIKEGLMSGLAAAGGGLLASGAGALGGKLFGKKGKKGKESAGAPDVMPAAGKADAGGGGGIGDTLKDVATSGAAAGADALVPGSGAVVEGLASQVDALQAPLEKAMSFGEKLKDLGKGLGGFIKEIGTGVGQAIKAVLQGLGQGLVSLATGIVALTPGIPVILAIGAALWMAAPAFEAIAPVLVKVAEVIGNVLVKALEVAGPIIEKIFTGIGYVIEKIGSAISGIINTITDSISKLSGLNPLQMLAVAGGIAAMAAAIAIFGGASAIGGALSGIGKFFGGDPIDKFRKFQELDASKLNMVAASITALATSMANFSGDASASVASSLKNLGTSLSDSFDSDLVDTLGGFTDKFAAILPQIVQLTDITPAIDETAMALHRLADSFKDLAGVDVKAINNLPWLRLISFAAAGGNIQLVQSANKSFNLTQDTAKNIAQMNTTNTAMLQVNKNLQSLLDATLTNNGEGGNISLMIDGKQVTKVIKRRTDNNQGQSAEGG